MTSLDLAEKYIELAMEYEEHNYAECGFEQATERRMKIYRQIKKGRLTEQEMSEVEPLFQEAGIDLKKHIKIQKRFLLF